jgi:hypothetical protein
VGKSPLTTGIQMEYKLIQPGYVASNIHQTGGSGGYRLLKSNKEISYEDEQAISAIVCQSEYTSRKNPCQRLFPFKNARYTISSNTFVLLSDTRTQPSRYTLPFLIHNNPLLVNDTVVLWNRSRNSITFVASGVVKCLNRCMKSHCNSVTTLNMYSHYTI